MAWTVASVFFTRWFSSSSSRRWAVVRLDLIRHVHAFDETPEAVPSASMIG